MRLFAYVRATSVDDAISAATDGDDAATRAAAFLAPLRAALDGR